MLSRIKIRNFKSFAEAEIRLRPLTVMIGANASGKTNFIEALGLLGWMAKGRQLSEIYSAVDDGELRLRGSLHQLSQYGNEQPIEFEADLDVGESLHFALEISINTTGLAVDREIVATQASTIYEAKTTRPQRLSVNFSEINFPPFIWSQDTLVVTHAPAFPWSEIRRAQLTRLSSCLNQIAVFCLIPDKMRGYANTVDSALLRSDGTNLSAVVQQLCRQGQKARILDFVRTLPEQDILDIDFLEVPSREHVVLKLLEAFGQQKHWQDAAVLSDGTLRTLGIAAALGSSQSLLIIEDIDDGVHPSRLGRMLELVRAHAEERDIRVLVTTHNPALLDAVSPAELRHVVACYRDPEQGDSRLIELGQLNEFPALVAQGRLGQLLTRGIVDHALKHDRTDEQRAADALEWLAELEASE